MPLSLVGASSVSAAPSPQLRLRSPARSAMKYIQHTREADSAIAKYVDLSTYIAVVKGLKPATDDEERKLDLIVPVRLDCRDGLSVESQRKVVATFTSIGVCVPMYFKKRLISEEEWKKSLNALISQNSDKKPKNRKKFQEDTRWWDDDSEFGRETGGEYGEFDREIGQEFDREIGQEFGREIGQEFGREIGREIGQEVLSVTKKIESLTDTLSNDEVLYEALQIGYTDATELVRRLTDESISVTEELTKLEAEMAAIAVDVGDINNAMLQCSLVDSSPILTRVLSVTLKTANVKFESSADKVVLVAKKLNQVKIDLEVATASTKIAAAHVEAKKAAMNVLKNDIVLANAYLDMIKRTSM